MGIEIRNSAGQIADLGEDTTINIERNCAIFTDDDKLLQDITYPVSLPKTPNNLVFFGGGHLVDAANSLYQLSVQLFVNGIALLSGSAEYSIKDDDFDVQLLVNFADVRNKIKNVLLSDIYDNELQLPSTGTDILNMMLQSCLYPERYDYAFFPVYNQYYAGVNSVGVPYQYPFTNSWNHATQQFVFDNLDEAAPGGPDQKTTRQSAFYKLHFWIRKVLKCLGFEAVGSFMDDEEAKQIYLYTDVAGFFASNLVIPNNITIEKFLKIIKLRFQLTIQFNVLTGKANVISFKSMLHDTEMVDISNYIEKITEIKTPTANGYTVSLMPDATDVLFKDPANTDQYISTNKMVVGDGEKNVEIEASTLKQSNTNSDYFYPTTKHVCTRFSNANSSQRLRFLRYVGFKPVSGGKVFPTAYAMELGQDDVNWYQFKNDAKQLKLTAYLPANVLERLNLSRKLFFISADGAAVNAIGEKVSFALSNAEDTLVKTEILCWSVNFQPTTQVQFIDTNVNPNTGDYKAKAYYNFDGKIEVKIKYPAGTRYINWVNGASETLESDILVGGFISESTDRYRAGGTTVNLPYYSVISADYNRIELWFSQKPTLVTVDGAENNLFTFENGYWVLRNMNAGSYAADRFFIWAKF